MAGESLQDTDRRPTKNGEQRLDSFLVTFNSPPWRRTSIYRAPKKDNGKENITTIKISRPTTILIERAAMLHSEEANRYFGRDESRSKRKTRWVERSADGNKLESEAVRGGQERSMRVFVGSRAAPRPTTGLCRVFALHSTGLALAKKGSEASQISQHQKGMELAGTVQRGKD